MTFIVGLTGGIGSGKSAAATLFEEFGAAVVDTVAIAHELTAPGGTAIAPIRAALGDEVVAPNGALDRAAMRRKVFTDAQAKGRLEAIWHPMIRAEADRRSAAARAPYVVLVVPLLVESGGYRSRVQRLLDMSGCRSNQALAWLPVFSAHWRILSSPVQSASM